MASGIRRHYTLKLCNHKLQPLILLAHAYALAYGTVCSTCGVQVFSLIKIQAIGVAGSLAKLHKCSQHWLRAISQSDSRAGTTSLPSVCARNIESYFCQSWFVQFFCQGQPREKSKTLCFYLIYLRVVQRRGPGSSVSITTGYGLDGPGIESRWKRDSPRLSRPALGSKQPSLEWVPVFPRGKQWPGRDAVPSPPSSALVEKG